MRLLRLYLYAGLSAAPVALLISVVQYFTVYPIIIEAERYEIAHTNLHGSISSEVEHHHESEWKPENGLQRLLFTALANFIYSFSFALLMLIALNFIKPVRWWYGFLWGGAAYYTFYLSTLLIYTPVLPGTIESTSLFARQMWWIASIESVLFGLSLIVFAPQLLIKLFSSVLVILPVIMGAPRGEVIVVVPQNIQNSFVWINSFVVCLYWVLLGLLTTLIYVQFNENQSITSTAMRSDIHVDSE